MRFTRAHCPSAPKSPCHCARDAAETRPQPIVAKCSRRHALMIGRWLGLEFQLAWPGTPPPRTFTVPRAVHRKAAGCCARFGTQHELHIRAMDAQNLARKDRWHGGNGMGSGAHGMGRNGHGENPWPGPLQSRPRWHKRSSPKGSGLLGVPGVSRWSIRAQSKPDVASKVRPMCRALLLSLLASDWHGIA